MIAYLAEGGYVAQFLPWLHDCLLTLKVLVATIDALGHFEIG